jgi:hypothetical protein
MDEQGIGEAHVSATYKGMELETATTDMNGQFVLRVYHDRSKAKVWIERVTGTALVSGRTSTTESGIIPHNHAAISGHGHWTLELTAEAPDHATDSVFVELPRNVHAPPVEIVLKPTDEPLPPGAGGPTVIILKDVEIAGPCKIEPPDRWEDDRPTDYRVSPSVPEGEFQWKGLRMRPRQAACPERTAPAGLVELLAELRADFEACLAGEQSELAGRVRFELTIEESGASQVSLLAADKHLRPTGIPSCFAEALHGEYPQPLAGPVSFLVSVELD